MSFTKISPFAPRMIRSPGNRQFGGIMDIFASIKPQTAPPTPPQGNNPSTVNNPGQPLPGVDPNNPTVPAATPPVAAPTPAKDESPFAGLGDIWQTPTQADDAPVMPAVDPAKLMEAAKQVDFTKSLSPEVLQKIAGGGEEAVKAMMTSLNNVAQTVFANSAMATTKIVEQALGRQAEQYNKNLPTQIRKLSANENLLTENPLLANPAVQPLVGALQEQLIRKNPNASATEIQQQVNAYFTALGTAFGPKPKVDPKTASKDVDWSAFFES